MSRTTGLGSGLLRCVERYKLVVFSVILIVLMYGLERILSKYAFSCPCTLIGDKYRTVPVTRQVYSALYIAVPALIFWILGSLLQERAWRCLSGCCCNQLTCRRLSRNCSYTVDILAKAIIMPTAWITFALLDGRYIDCGVSEVPRDCMSWVINESSKASHRNRSHEVRVWSQVAGLCLATAVLSLYLLVVILRLCCSRMTHYEKRFANHVSQLERRTFDAAAQEELEIEFKKKWRALMRDGTREDWMQVSDVNTSPTELDGQTYYTAFHLWQSGISITEENLNSTYTKNPPNKMADFKPPEFTQQTEKRQLPPIYSSQRISPIRQNGLTQSSEKLPFDSTADDTQPLASTDNTKKKRAKKTKRSQVQDMEASTKSDD